MNFSIIVIGPYGRMGKAIIDLAKEKNIHIDALIDRSSNAHSSQQYSEFVISSDYEDIFSKYPHAVVIDFTAPDSSIAIAQSAAKYKNPLIIGTTGFTLDQFTFLENLSKTSRIFWSPNMSIGINVLLKYLPQLTQDLGSNYDIEVLEMHHNKKKDTPSGTALRLAETLSSARNWKFQDVVRFHREGFIDERSKEEIGIQSIRCGDVIGVHTIYFGGPGERIEITHQAHSRKNFAQGAISAAEWLIKQKPGTLYTMTNII